MLMVLSPELQGLGMSLLLMVKRSGRRIWYPKFRGVKVGGVKCPSRTRLVGGSRHESAISILYGREFL